VGCGMISGQYSRVLKESPRVRLVGGFDLDRPTADSWAKEHSARSFSSLEELLAEPSIQVVINLTPPRAHAEVTEAALAAGKHVYSEKPLATTSAEARRLCDLAQESGLALCSAPDTFLGYGIQAARQAIDEGLIGEPFALNACFASHGMEHWHPNPGFFYKKGAGPAFDMGPYYLTAIIFLLGPVVATTSLTTKAFPFRQVEAGPRKGEQLEVEVPTHLIGLMKLREGPIASITLSFDVWATELPRIEIYGTKGTLSVPDPNTFSGPLRLAAGRSGWRELEIAPPPEPQGRGIGVLELIEAVSEARPPLTHCSLGLHVTEVLESLTDESNRLGWREITSSVERPAPYSRPLIR
jgi:predicted dehydrogenase